MKFAPKFLAAALCLGLAGQVFATDLKHWPADQAKALDDALCAGRAALRVLLDNAQNDAHLAGSISVNFMMLFGYLSGGWLMARSALSAQALLDSGNGDPQFLGAKLITANFYAEQLLPRVHALLAAIGGGSKSIMALDDEQF